MLQGDYHDLQSYFNLMRISPWQDFNLFSQCFLHVPKNRKRSTPFSGYRRAILVTTLQGMTIRRNCLDLFEAEAVTPIVDTITKVEEAILTQEEQALQTLTKPWWDPVLRHEMAKTGMSKKEIFEAFSDTRLFALHPSLPSYDYEGDEQEQFDPSDPTTESQVWKDTIEASSKTGKGRKRHGAVNAAAREKFKQTMVEDGKWKSTKICATVDAVLSALNLTDPKEKGGVLVFCEFLRALDLIDIGLRENKVLAIRYDGTVDLKTRDSIEKRFNQQTEDEPMVLLLTTGAGGVGLNLQAARWVILPCPDWNPSTRCTAYPGQIAGVKKAWSLPFSS